MTSPQNIAITSYQVGQLIICLMTEGERQVWRPALIKSINTDTSVMEFQMWDREAKKFVIRNNWHTKILLIQPVETGMEFNPYEEENRVGANRSVEYKFLGVCSLTYYGNRAYPNNSGPSEGDTPTTVWDRVAMERFWVLENIPEITTLPLSSILKNFSVIPSRPPSWPEGATPSKEPVSAPEALSEPPESPRMGILEEAVAKATIATLGKEVLRLAEELSRERLETGKAYASLKWMEGSRDGARGRMEQLSKEVEALQNEKKELEDRITNLLSNRPTNFS